MKIIAAALLVVMGVSALSGQTLGQAGSKRALLMGAAADADEFGPPNRLSEPPYAATLAAQYTMIEAENAMKWGPIHPAQSTYNFVPGDNLADFAAAHAMKMRGHNLCWGTYNPGWLTTLALTATPAEMSAILQDHISTVMHHYAGRVFAWDVVNEAISDSSSGTGTTIKDSIWSNQPGIGLPGTGYVEQAFRWAHAADPGALLFYNEYNIESPGAKFQGLYNMVKDFLARGVPIHGVGIQMHVDSSNYPGSEGLAQNIQQLTALGLQVHITEMDVRIPVDSTGNATAANLQLQAHTYQRFLTVCLQNPGCTAFQTWGFTDKYSWIPGNYAGLGAALPFDANYQAKPALSAMIGTLQTVAPIVEGTAIVNAASYQKGAVAPGELVTVFHANYGPSSLVGAQLDSSGLVSSNLGGIQVLFDGVAAPVIYALTGQSSVVVPYAVAGKQQTMMQYEYNGIQSNTVALQVAASAPAIFAADATGRGQGLIRNQDNLLNSAQQPAAAGSVIQILATGGGTIAGGAIDGALATQAGQQTLAVTATVGGLAASVMYAGPAPGEVNGVMQVNLSVPAGLAAGPQPVVIVVNGAASQPGITVAVQ